MTDLYDQRIDAIKARERKLSCAETIWSWRVATANELGRNTDRLAAYKRKRAAVC